MATRARVVAPFALAALSAAAGLSLGRVFDSGRFILPVLGAALLPHAIGALARSAAVVGAVGLGLAVVALAALRGVGAGGTRRRTFGIPTASTFETLRQQLRGGWHLLRTAPAPAPVTDGTLLLAVVATWTVANGRRLARVPSQRHPRRGCSGTRALRLVVGARDVEQRDDHRRRLRDRRRRVPRGAEHRRARPSSELARVDKPARGHWLAPAVLLGLVALLVGLVLAPALPGAENDPILDFANTGPNHNGGRSYSTRVPPLVDVGAKLQKEDNYEVFTVKASQPDYWRLTALDDFTTAGGGQWTLSAEGSDEVQDDLPEHAAERHAAPGVRHRTARRAVAPRRIPSGRGEHAGARRAVVGNARQRRRQRPGPPVHRRFPARTAARIGHGRATSRDGAARYPRTLQRYTDLPPACRR